MKPGHIFIVFSSIVWIFFINKFLCPLYYSDDDVLMLYRLSGADGFLPTSITHFNYGWHFIFSFLTKNLFLLYPKWNWYSFILVSLNFISIIVIGFLFLNRTGIMKGLFIHFIYLLLITPEILLKLNITSTSLHLGLSGMFMLYSIKGVSKNFKVVIVPFFLLVFSGILRLHMCGLVILLFLLYILICNVDILKKIISTLFFALLTLGLLYIMHVDYCKKNIPQWRIKEDYRQSVYDIINKPSIEKKPILNDYYINDFIDNGIIFDTNYVSIYKINHVIRQSNFRYRNPFDLKNIPVYYWTIKNNLYFTPILFLLLLLLFMADRIIFRKYLFGIFTMILIFFFFFIFFKLTAQIVFSIIAVTLLVLFCQINVSNTDFHFTKSNTITSVLITIISIAWGVRVMFSTHQINHSISAHLRAQLKEINEHPSCLFILTKNSVDLGKYPLWQIPTSLPMRNALDIYRQLLFNTTDILNRFYLDSDFKKNDFNSRVVFVAGSSSSFLKKMYPSLDFTNPLSEFKTMEVRRIINH